MKHVDGRPWNERDTIKSAGVIEMNYEKLYLYYDSRVKALKKEKAELESTREFSFNKIGRLCVLDQNITMMEMTAEAVRRQIPSMVTFSEPRPTDKEEILKGVVCDGNSCRLVVEDGE